MPARIRVQPPGPQFRVIFSRPGQQPIVMIATDPANAWEHGIFLLSQQSELMHGDNLAVRQVPAEEVIDIP
jgi:hypothetical protein